MNGSSLISRIPPVTKNLLAINVLIYIVGVLMPRVGVSIDNNLALYYVESPAFKPFQLLTYMFVHGGFTHLFFNMFALWMFGGVIERALGSKRFLFYYLSCGVGAALIQEGVFALMIAKYHDIFDAATFEEILVKGLKYLRDNLNFTDPSAGTLNALANSPTVGASGAIYGILLAFGMLFPNQPIYLMFIPIPIKAKWMVLGYGVLELLLGVSGTAPGVAHWAHLGGMVFGVFMILYWKRKGDFNDRWFL